MTVPVSILRWDLFSRVLQRELAPISRPETKTNTMNGFCRLRFHLCASVNVLVFTVSLHGHLQVCRIYILTNNKERANRQTHTQGNNKNNEGKQRKPQMENIQCVTTLKKGSKPKKQRSRILQTYIYIYIYPTHLNMAM
jgi:hypothetical protein